MASSWKTAKPSHRSVHNKGLDHTCVSCHALYVSKNMLMSEDRAEPFVWYIS